MTTKRIIYTRPDGGVSIIVPAPGFTGKFADETEALVAVQARSIPNDATDVKIVERATIPTDRWFRDAWTRSVGGGPIEINMSRARDIQASKIHQARKGEMARLQDEEGRARLTERSADANKHATDHVALEVMNLTAIAASIASAANPAALKAVWPAELLVRDNE